MTYIKQANDQLARHTKELLKDPQFQEYASNYRSQLVGAYGEAYVFQFGNLEYSLKASLASYRFLREADTGGMSIRFGFDYRGEKEDPNTAVPKFQNSPLTFEISKYPYCCGMRMLNGFSHTDSRLMTQELFDKIMNMFVGVWFSVDSTISRRLMIIMPEYGNAGLESRFIPSDRKFDPDKAFSFPKFYHWAKKFPMRDQQMSNYNSGNILHQLEVIWSNK